MAANLDTNLTRIEEAAKLYFTIDLQLKELDSDFKRLEREFSEIRIGHVKMESRIAAPEGLRDSMRKDVEIEIRDAVSQMKIGCLTRQLDLIRASTDPVLPSPEG